MASNPPLTPSQVTAPTGSPEDVLAPGIAGGFPGNLKDDDPLALDEYFEAADSGPEEYGGIPVPVATIDPVTRLVVWKQEVQPLSQSNPSALMALPADTNRKRIYIHLFSASLNAFFYSSEKFSFFGPYPAVGTGVWSLPINAAVVLPGDTTNGLGFSTLVLEEHTGPLWVAAYAAVATANVGVSVVAVTC